MRDLGKEIAKLQRDGILDTSLVGACTCEHDTATIPHDRGCPALLTWPKLPVTRFMDRHGQVWLRPYADGGPYRKVVIDYVIESEVKR